MSNIVIELHDFVFLIGALVAVLAAISKIWAANVRKDGRKWLRLLAACACIWLATIWVLQAIDIIPIGPIGFSLAIPGVVVLLTLEATHAFIGW